MTRSLGDLAWWDHRSALWWLGLLYRRPHQFREALEACSRGRAFVVGLLILGHALPYVVILAALLRCVLFGLLGVPPRETLPPDASAVLFHATLLVRGIAVGITSGIAIGIAVGIAGGIVRGINAPFALGVATGGIASGFAFGIASGIAFGIAFGITVGIASLRVYYQPLHPWFVWPVLQVRWYAAHPVSWDDLCLLPFPGLHRLLVAYAEASPEGGNAEIERLISSYPSQRGQALRARTTLTAREAGTQHDLGRLGEIVASLPEGDKGFLAQTAEVSRTIGEIAAAQRRLDAIKRPFMREPYASLVIKEIENFRGRVSGFREPLSSEFRAAAGNWLAIAQRQLADVQRITRAKPTPQVFRAGGPVDRALEAFVPRLNVFGQLEREIMLATGCPGLLIYGRRRMGKSTLLRNLDGFLPPSVHLSVISMLNPAAFTSTASFIRLVVEQAKNAGLPRDLGSDDLSGFFAFLQAANVALADQQRRVVLAFDEFEQFDAKMGSAFDEDLLSTIRESVQSHRQLIWVFAGSHHITELKNAPWPSYFVSIRTVEVPRFSPEETRLLLTEPLKQSPLFHGDDKPPRFDPAFWGKDGIERIHVSVLSEFVPLVPNENVSV